MSDPKYTSYALAVILFSLNTMAKEPDCSKPESWAGSMAFVELKNSGITSNNEIDFSKTKVVKIASQKKGKDLYRQVHEVEFFKSSGQKIQVITVNDASAQECSMTGVDVFLVEKQMGVGPVKLEQKLKEERAK